VSYISSACTLETNKNPFHMKATTLMGKRKEKEKAEKSPADAQ